MLIKQQKAEAKLQGVAHKHKKGTGKKIKKRHPAQSSLFSGSPAEAQMRITGN